MFFRLVTGFPTSLFPPLLSLCLSPLTPFLLPTRGLLRPAARTSNTPSSESDAKSTVAGDFRSPLPPRVLLLPPPSKGDALFGACVPAAAAESSRVSPAAACSTAPPLDPSKTASLDELAAALEVLPLASLLLPAPPGVLSVPLLPSSSFCQFAMTSCMSLGSYSSSHSWRGIH